MDINQFTPLSGYGSISGTNSLTIFSSATGTRWNLTGLAIGWQGNLALNLVSLYEVGNLASQSVANFPMSATSGFWAPYYGDLGIQASDTNTALVARTFVANLVRVTTLFTGYRQGNP